MQIPFSLFLEVIMTHLLVQAQLKTNWDAHHKNQQTI